MRNEQIDKYPKVEPAELDHMPREVATAHLTNPHVRMSGAFRRACERARHTVYTSEFPIRKMFPDFLSEEFYYVRDTDQTPKTAEARFTGKLRGFTWAKLHQILARCDRRSDRMFTVAQKVSGNEKLSESVRIKLAEHFQAQADKFDWLHGLTNNEIQRRVALCETQ